MTTLLPLLIALAVTVLAYRALRRGPVADRLDRQLRIPGTPGDTDPGSYDHQRQWRDLEAVRSHEDDRSAA
ncbi:MAG TPA: hypothetical protein VK083_14410 [Nocardia sp.]|uniref:hypothetical protein n=1 Tax=Nocardia TaxID=1817 RepID=UPI002456E449|nr:MULTISPECIES: hypothetical protein [Nocardia]HLS77973.1 hypothetical protein [Nocardia sp.]